MNGMVPQYRTPPSLGWSNALLQGAQLGSGLKQRGELNKLLEARETRAAEQHAWTKEDRDTVKTARALSAALGAKNPKLAKDIFKKLGGKGIDLSSVGADVKFTMADGTTIAGPQAEIESYLQAVMQDPGWAGDENKRAQAEAFLQTKGVSITAPKAKKWVPETPAEVAAIEGLKTEAKEKVKAKYKTPPKPTEAEKTMPFKGQRTLKQLTHDKEGKPLDKPSQTDIAALSKSLEDYGQEVAQFEIPTMTQFFPDKKGRTVYLTIEQGQDVSAEDLLNLLVDDYDYSEEEAQAALQLLIGKQ